MSTKQLEHSPKGASSMERWSNCPGSTQLIKALELPPADPSDYAIEGTNAHTVAAHCLRTGIDAWETIGKFKGEKGEFEVTVEMTDAVQMYLDVIRGLLDAAGPTAVHLVEERISGDINADFYGTVDDAIVGETVLDITDYKHGVGIAVDAEWNKQLLYYAVGILERYMGPVEVRLRIVQPRAFHPGGPVRVWKTTSTEILAWRDEVLRPAMERAEFEHILVPGSHCHFCPALATRSCPALKAMFKAAAEANPVAVPNYSDETLALEYQMLEAVGFYKKAVEGEMLKRLNSGSVFEGTAKLVKQKADRVWKPEAQETLVRELGAEEIFTKPELKSPAQIDALGAKAKTIVKSLAYTPQTGLTVARWSDKRAAIKVQTSAEAFASYAMNDEVDNCPE